MGKKRGLVELKLTGDRIECLHYLYGWLVTNWEAYTAHDLLLKGHIVELRDKLKEMTDRGQLRYTFSLTPLQALAFVQVWENDPVELEPYYAMIIQSIFDKLDKKVKSPLWQQINGN